MKHNGKYKGPSEGLKKQQVLKKLNMHTQTKKSKNENMINDLDTQSFAIEKLRNDPKDSKPDNSSDQIFPSSGDVSKHSINKNGEISNTDSGKGNIKDSNVSTLSTAITKSDEIANAKKVSAFINKILHNNLPKEMTEWPLCLLIESKQSIKISQQEFQNMIIKKSAEIMATKSRYSKQMINIEVCKEQQRSYYKKYKQLLNYINSMNDELVLLNREPSNVVKHVRNVGTYINMPENNDSAKKIF